MLRGGFTFESLGHVKLRFTITNLTRNAMCKTELAVRTGTNAQVIAKLPIVQVVPTFVTRLGIG